MFSPRKVAFVGVSSDPTKPGNRGINFMRANGYEGEIFGVNPSARSLEGVTVVSSIAELPEAIDVAVIALPGDQIIGAVEACGKHGIPYAIVFANGFADVGNFVLQDELKHMAQSYGMRLIGPNCLGVLDMRSSFAGTFSSLLARGQLKVGGIGLVSQSGAVGNTVLLSFVGLDLGVAAWMATGNEADFDALEGIEWMLERDDTEVVIAVLEAVNRAGAQIQRIGQTSIARQKPLLVFKAGKSEASRRAAESHTGKIVGSHDAWNRVVSDAGLLTVESLEHLTDAALALSACGWREVGPIAILCGSGGMGGIICDDLSGSGLELAELSKASVERLESLLPAGASTKNPVDPTTVREDVYWEAAAALVADEGVGTLLLAVNSLARDFAGMPERLLALAAIAKALGKRVALTYFSPHDALQSSLEQKLHAAGILILPTSARLALAIGTVNKWHSLIRNGDMVHSQEAKNQSSAARSRGDVRALPELAPLLSEHGIPVIPTIQVHETKEALTAPRGPNGKLVLKLEGSRLAHKSDAGLVRLNLADDDAIGVAVRELTNLKAVHGGGIVAQPQLENAQEVIIGGVLDAELGWLVTVGLGGVLVELIGEMEMALCPLSEGAARHLLERGKLGQMLRGYRDQQPRDVAALAAAVAATSRLLAGSSKIAEFEINPIMVGPQGAGVCAVDALASFQA